MRLLELGAWTVLKSCLEWSSIFNVGIRLGCSSNEGFLLLGGGCCEKGATSLVVGIRRGKKPQPGGVQAGYHDWYSKDTMNSDIQSMRCQVVRSWIENGSQAFETWVEYKKFT
jgi:hypothetical protein